MDSAADRTLPRSGFTSRYDSAEDRDYRGLGGQPAARAVGRLPRSGRVFRTPLIRFTGMMAMMQQLTLAW
jgi:hypothetical protein